MTGELPRIKVRVVLRLARSLTKHNTSILRKDTRTPSFILPEEVLVKSIVYPAFSLLPSMQSRRFHSQANTTTVWQPFIRTQMPVIKGWHISVLQKLISTRPALSHLVQSTIHCLNKNKKTLMFNYHRTFKVVENDTMMKSF